MSTTVPPPPPPFPVLQPSMSVSNISRAETSVVSLTDGQKRGKFRYWDKFLTTQEGKSVLEKCMELTAKRALVADSLGGTKSLRRSIGFADKGYIYQYNGGKHEAREWPTWLLQLRNQMQETLNQPFEFA